MTEFPYTVVIPVYNRAAMLPKCLEPLMCADCAGLEVVVVDDGSSDGSADVARGLAEQSAGAHIRVVRQPNGGPGAARNTGAALVRTEWIAFLDSDDSWFPGTARVLARLLSEQTEASLIFLKMHEATEMPDRFLSPDAEVIFRRHEGFVGIMREEERIHIGSCNAAIRTSAFRATGGFATDIFYSEDTHLFWRLPKGSTILEVTSPEMIYYCLHDEERLSDISMRVRDGVSRIVYDIGRGEIGTADPETAKVVAERSMFVARKLFAKGHVTVPMAILLDGFPLFHRRYGLYATLRAMATPLLIRLGIGRNKVRTQAPDPA
jgi:glycosyltransferase involved in cell wall biosynthesis